MKPISTDISCKHTVYKQFIKKEFIMDLNTNKMLDNLKDDSKPPSNGNEGLALFLNNLDHTVTSQQIGISKSRKPISIIPNELLQVPSSNFCNEFRKKYYSNVSLTDWNNWHWQLQNRIRKLSDLERFIKLSEGELRYFYSNAHNLPLSITPYYAHLLTNNEHHSAIRHTIVPLSDELVSSFGESIDPLAEDSHSPVPGIIHRYPDRVLFLVTDFCSVFCRYCTRSRLVGGGGEFNFSRSQWEAALQYIEATPTIRDVLISGGDPLTLSDDRIDYLLNRLKAIRHIEIVRIGTKVPVVLPQRITPNLVRILKKYHPLWISINFVHPMELTLEVSRACEKLANAGIPLGSQTVLLKNINDNSTTLKQLFTGLMKIRVKPYYLYQCDPISGSKHFRTSIDRGLEIMSQLRGFISGYAVPTYVVDAPGGGGKIPISNNTIVNRDEKGWKLKNFQNVEYFYPDEKERI